MGGSLLPDLLFCGTSSGFSTGHRQRSVLQAQGFPMTVSALLQPEEKFGGDMRQPCLVRAASQWMDPTARSSPSALRQQVPHWAAPKPSLGGPRRPLPVLLHTQPVSPPQAHVPNPRCGPNALHERATHSPEPPAWPWPLNTSSGFAPSHWPPALLPRGQPPLRIPPDGAEKGDRHGVASGCT